MTSILDVDDYYDLIYLATDTDLFPIIGNFYFIQNKELRESLTFDFNYFMTIDGMELLKTDKSKSKNFWNAIKYLCYPNHTMKTYRHNLFYLEFIAIFSWEEFVINYNNAYL